MNNTWIIIGIFILALIFSACALYLLLAPTRSSGENTTNDETEPYTYE